MASTHSILYHINISLKILLIASVISILFRQILLIKILNQHLKQKNKQIYLDIVHLYNLLEHRNN